MGVELTGTPDTYVPQIEQRMWFPSAVFGLTSGSPAVGISGGGRWKSLLYDAAATEVAAVGFMVPAYVENVNIELVWTNQGAGSGDVVWSLSFDRAGDGQTLAASGGGGSSGELTITAPAQDILKVSTLLTVAIDPTKLHNLRLSRVGGSVNDTLANDAAVLGVRVTPF